MQSHLGDLREEVQKEFGTIDETWLNTIRDNWRTAALTPVDQALCAYAEKLTRTPAAMTEADLQRLRGLGLEDKTLHDAIQVTSFFNYINRIADATHVDLDPGMDPR
ncbi:MAG: hypothetical protein P1V35_08465 [Planctomycetota bacterium]|nr:hypothetical protein [Planctomycetota bacterium]